MSRYTSDKSDMSNLGKHLTNVAVQKHSGKAAYKRTGAKWDVERLKTYLLSTAGQDVVNRLFCDIESIVINSLLAVQKVMINDKHCFELYGFDILIDTDYRPWLLEVNTFPSISSSSPFDKRVKTMLVADALTLAGFMPFDHELVDRAMKDDNVKRLKDALSSCGFWNDTALFFLSDNGGMPYGGGNNYPFRGGKTTAWEGGVRVPAFVRLPPALEAAPGDHFSSPFAGGQPACRLS